MDSTQININHDKDDNEIDIKKIFNTLKRNKKLIFGFILGASIISSYKFFKAIPIWSGSFNIVVKEPNNSENRGLGVSNMNPIFNLTMRFQLLENFDFATF